MTRRAVTAAPRARPAVTPLAVLVAVGLVALGVVAVRDLAVSWGRSRGQAWLPAAVDWVDGLRPDEVVVPVVGVVALLVGLGLLVAAVRPGRRTHLRVQADPDLWVTPAGAAALARAAADRADGVLAAETARTGVRRTRVEVLARHGAGEATRAAATEAAEAALAGTGVRVSVTTKEVSA